MKVVELLKVCHPALKTLSDNEVSRDDWRYVDLYEEFVQMRSLGVKYVEAVRMLAEDYGVGRATVERVVARLGKEIVLNSSGSTAAYGTGGRNVKKTHGVRGKRR